MSPLRGKDALRVDDRGTVLEVTAELARAAKQRRKRGDVFNRVAILRDNPYGLYWVSVAVSPTHDDAQEFVACAMSSTLRGTLDGAEIRMSDGTLHIRVPVTASDLSLWKVARDTGTKWTELGFTLPTYCRFEGEGPDHYFVRVAIRRWSPDESKMVPAWVTERRRETAPDCQRVRLAP